MPKEPEQTGPSGVVPDDEILPEYGLRGGVRAKYAGRHVRGIGPVPPDSGRPDVLPDAGTLQPIRRSPS